jgi:hypothetical protein
MIMDTNKVQYAFHKGDKGSAKEKAVSEIIKLVTYSRDCRRLFGTQFSHVEMIFPKWVRYNTEFENKNCFSSRGMDNPSGVNFKQIEFSHPDRWVIIPDNVLGVDDISRAFARAQSLIGQGYDYRGVVSYFAPIGLRKVSDTKMWCSEACATAGGFSPVLVSPNELALMVTRRNNGSI